MKGIILAGGSGTRLYPITKGISKQLIPVYDKPMVYYPLSVLMLAGIKDIMVITTPEDQEGFKRLLGSGKNFGINLEYCVQPSPDGLAQAFILGESFINGEPCAMVLGDNIYFGNGFVDILKNARKEAEEKDKASIFGYQVHDPERFGIVELDDDKNVLSVEEKPKNPKSNFAITGLYFYPEGVSEYAKNVKPSDRGELEITSLNDMYLSEQRLRAELLGGGFTWYDTGVIDSLNDASNMIKAVQSNSGKILCCPEAIGYNQGWINRDELLQSADLMKKNEYGQFLYKEANKVRVRK
ncbi:MAG TPA: glucose-1-phosphate thymidylyltransferase RfbA [Bacilli bacterium]|jgi:glucose-1-phosphate thymidylyltransferase|nr:glucose-1-phosphate thymidylyltransferase RfbA [Bacilli bacterium]HPZ23984.1 glucose-1-phosphate thymidylyltransferase RfbA [Bacilli bacterium]HQC84181.1 glucose-1-phosphate thymidylyltransferase RfbA [Bacilli bacterium]